MPIPAPLRRLSTAITVMGRSIPALAQLPWLAAVLLVLLASLDVHAARIENNRVVEPKRFAQLSGMRAISLMPQQGMAVLGSGFGNDGGISTGTTMAISNSGIPAGSFAAGAAAGVAGAMVSDAIMETRIRKFEDHARNILLGLGPAGRWNELQLRWQAAIVSALQENPMIEGVATHTDPATHEEDAASLRCNHRETCVTVFTIWGLSTDGRRIETLTQVMVWAPELRGMRSGHSTRPHFYNILRYRSSAVPPVDRAKTPDDVRWLTWLADEVNAAMPLREYVAKANAGSGNAAAEARREVTRIQRIQRARIKAAKAKKWDDINLAAATARQWAMDDAKLLRDALEEALNETVRMLRIELSAEGQAAKFREPFRSRDARAIATVLDDDERVLAYLHDGTLVSVPRDDAKGIGVDWDIVVDETAARNFRR